MTPAIVTLVMGLLLGYLAQRSRICFIGGLRCAPVLAVIPGASVIHDRMSASESLLPTPSSGPLVFPFPATEWHSVHF